MMHGEVRTATDAFGHKRPGLYLLRRAIPVHADPEGEAIRGRPEAILPASIRSAAPTRGIALERHD